MRHSTELVISKLDLGSPETFHERTLSMSLTASWSGMAMGNSGVVILPIWIFLPHSPISRGETESLRINKH